MSDAHAFFYDSVNGDRVYNADSFSNWLKKFFTTGVFTGDLQVLAGDGMQITIQSGYCNINGKVMMWDTATTLDVTTANATYDRIDIVVAERNDTDRDFTLKVITGSATDTPTAKAPVREGTIYQIVLAQIYVKAGATAITQADITDKRSDKTVCGYVAATVKEIDFSQIQAQYDSYMENYKKAVAADYKNYTDQLQTDHAGFQAGIANYEELEKRLYNSWSDSMQAYQQTAQTNFNNWFDSVKGKMDGDTGAKLTGDVSDLTDSLNLLKYMVMENDYFAPLLDTDGNIVLDSESNAVAGGWKYQEV